MYTCEKQIHSIQLSSTYFVQNVSHSMDSTTAIVLAPVTIATALTMISLAVLCSRTKKRGTAEPKPPPEPVDVEKKEVKKETKEKEIPPSSNAQKDEGIEIKFLKELNEKKERRPREKDNKSSSLFGSMEAANDGDNRFAENDQRDASYPYIPEPTASVKRKREQELEKDKEKKIKEGFYQSRSDEDDTLEPIKSLKNEDTDPEDKSATSKKGPKKKNESQRVSQGRKPKSQRSYKNKQEQQQKEQQKKNDEEKQTDKDNELP